MLDTRLSVASSRIFLLYICEFNEFEDLIE